MILYMQLCLGHQLQCLSIYNSKSGEEGREVAALLQSSWNTVKTKNNMSGFFAQSEKEELNGLVVTC